jgi:putative oxidoreductase
MQILTRILGLRDLARRGDSLILLLLRLNMGILFASSGWGKIHDLASVTSFFTDLHIPFPAFNAVLVATTELVGGLLVLLGLGTRLAAIPLTFTMVIAILTAKLADIGGVVDLATTDELTYGLVLLALVVFGPGKLAVDHLIDKRLSAASR